MYLPSNGATANVVNHDLELHFKDTNVYLWTSRYINGSHTQLKIVAKFQLISNAVCGNNFAPFPPFPGGVKNMCSQCSRKVFSLIWDFSVDYDQGTQGFLVSIFQVEKSPGKTNKKLNISYTIQLIFFKFSQNDQLSSHLIFVTGDLENEGQY